MSQGRKLLIEAGPLLVFFAVNWKAGIYWGTGAFMAATAISLAVSWFTERRIPLMPLIGAGFVALFGALTLIFHDDIFIKLKVTLINALFGGILLGGLLFNQLFLKLVMGEAMKITDEGWKKLTVRWALFFFAMALLNEYVWRSYSTDAWVNFKVFGLLPLTFVFAISQAPLMLKHALPDDAKP